MHLWRAAFRSVAGRPALAAVIVVTLAIGIGANSAIFSAVDTVLLKPLPYPDGDRLVAVYERNLARPQATQLLAPGRLEEWNSLNHSFTALAATYFENMTDTSGAEPERVAAMRTSPRFFDVLGVAPALGRIPTPEEERFGGPSVAVASDAYWRLRLGADPHAVGRRLVLGGAAVTLIGVMPPSFRYPSATTELWVPTKAPQFFLQARAARLYTAIGRLKPGITLQQATADLDAVQVRLGGQYPETDRGWGATLVPVKEEQVAGVRRSLWVLFAAVGLLLVAACGTVACLLLADGARRQREIAVRLALGADRTRVVVQLLGEGTVLAGGGIAAGLLVALFGIRGLRAFATQLPRVSDLALDARLVIATVAGGAATTLLFALVPAWRATRVDPAGALARRGRGHTSVGGGLQRSLVAAQIALAAVLLVGAVLLIRSFEQLQAVSPGFDPTGVVTFRMSAQWSEPTSGVVQRQARTVARLTTIPGIDAAAFSQQLPAGLTIPPGEFTIVGRDSREKTFAAGRAVGPGYFQTLHIPFLSGNTCSADAATPPYTNAIVSRAFVTRYFPDSSPLGHALTAPGFPPGTEAKIVGIVGDVHENGITAPADPLIYWCGYNPYWPDVYFLVRTAADHPATMADIRSAMREIEPGRAVYSVRTLPDLLTESTAQQRLTTVLVALFGVTALLLAALGLSGVLSQAVSARQREFGIRVAVGATPGSIVRLVLAQAAVLVGAGLAIGTATALASARLMAALLFSVTPRDPVTFTIVPLILIATALAAAALPARRAATVDPIEPLRAD